MSAPDMRMYESKYPEVDDVVMVQVKSIAEMGAYVALLGVQRDRGNDLAVRAVKEAYQIDHQAHQGTKRCNGGGPKCSLACPTCAPSIRVSFRHVQLLAVFFSFLTAYGQYRDQRLLQVGRQEPVMVLRVDKEKGYIDLSKRRVAAEDLAACEDRWNKSKMVHSIMRHLAEITGQELEVLYKAVGWPLYKAYGHAFEAFKVASAASLCLCFGSGLVQHAAPPQQTARAPQQQQPSTQCSSCQTRQVGYLIPASLADHMPV